MTSGSCSNYWFVMRHGESEANSHGLIISSPEKGCNDYGLTTRGRSQVLQSAGNSSLDDSTIIISSDFKRTLETARLVAETINAKHVVTDTRLRERCFGELDGSSNSEYTWVWEQDRLDGRKTQRSIEPVTAVADRMLSLYREYENIHIAKTILIVSHGDPLQILISALRGHGTLFHRDIPHMETAEIRAL
jgi:broad specificity phosphatase PhoE